ncbi:MAG: SDR family oxidoreductase [Nocardioides sp.]
MRNGSAGRMAGRVAVVTGIGSGIGKGVALRYAAEGATLVGIDISAAAARASADQAAEAGAPYHSIHTCDLTVPGQVRELVAELGTTHGRIDTLVNAGAIQPHMAPVWEMDYETQFRATIAGEVDLVFIMCHEAWGLLRASGRAAVINFASVNSFRASRQMAMTAHTAGKGAVLSMSRQFAVEGGPDRIRVNTIAPGLIQTDATRAAGAAQGDLGATIVARTLLGRLGVPEDIAQCALWLGSDESSWVTGTNVVIDGGVTAA